VTVTGDARYGRRDNQGRRDNGLVAAEYASAGDVDPRVGEHLLDVLALEGIAAYLRPSTDLHPVTRSSSLPARPTDRLYVDRAHLATARGMVARLSADADDRPHQDRPHQDRPRRQRPDDAGPHHAAPDEAAPDDMDLAWESIVAGYDAEIQVPRRPWPAAEDVADTGSSAPDTDPHHGGLLRAAPEDQLSLLDGLDTFGAHLPDDEEEGFTPPAPPPLPRPSLPTALGIAGIFGGLIILLSPGLMPIGEDTALLTGFCAILAGFVTLIWRLRPGDDEDDGDGDDGAKV
jgi:hypothetical protein